MATKKQPPKPEPVSTNIICSICDEPWGLHSKDANGEVSTLECVRLLKAKRYTPTITIQRPWVSNPWVYPSWPYSTAITCASGGNISAATGTTINATNTATPTIAMASAA